jgi:hypothetical protein
MSWTDVQVEGLVEHYFKTRGGQFSTITGCHAHYVRQGLPGGGPSRVVFQKGIGALVAKGKLRKREERATDAMGGWESTYEIAAAPPAGGDAGH